MRQVVFSRRSAARLAETATPALKRGAILVRVSHSAISVGTERSAGLGAANVVQKLLEKPQQVGQVVAMAMSDGVSVTAQRVRAALDAWMPSGYSNAGTVIALGEGVTEFHVGDRVACAGGGYATHAEYCVVPRRLAVRIPQNVSFEHAAFATIGAIAMHGYRAGDLRLGESCAIVGLGIIGQILCQIAAAGGTRVISIDLDGERAALAARLSSGTALTPAGGSEVREVFGLTDGRGADAVFLCAATPSNEPVALGMNVARDRGRVVVVGDVGLALDRQLMYDKELELRISRSYGPGRYDREYEEGGRDYPYSYVRWTQQRNMAAVLELMSAGKLDLDPLITHRFPIDDAERAFASLSAGEGRRPIGAVFAYPAQPADQPRREIRVGAAKARAGAKQPRIALIGPGAFATGVLIPALAKNGVVPTIVAGNGGLAAVDAARRLGMDRATTDIDTVFSDPEVDVVMIASRHGSHAELVVRALEARKHVYVEKPLAMSEAEIELICAAYNRADREVMVGFNRRFAPAAVRARDWLPAQVPPVMTYRVNAGAIDARHWSKNDEEGGGRIIGEACHFVDLMQHFARAPVSQVFARAHAQQGGLEEDVTVAMSFANGAIGSLVYTSQGTASYPKEWFEAFAGGRVICINDFAALTLAGTGTGKRMKGRQDKGFVAEMAAFLKHVRGEADVPIPFTQSVTTSLATLAVVESCRTNVPVDVPAVSV